MKRREDWKLLKELSKHYENTSQLALRPLIVLEDNTVLNDNVKKRIGAEGSVKDHLEASGPSNWIDFYDNNFFNDDFLFLDKSIPVNNSNNESVLPYNFVRFNKRHYEGKTLLLMDFYTLYGDRYTTICNTDSNLIRVFKHQNKNVNHFDFDESNIIETNGEEFQFLVIFMIKVFVFFHCLSESDLYPVEKTNQPTKKIKPHVAKKKPWMREDLVSIVFLNQLPRGQSESKGGHHASPRYHHRRGTWVHLSNERYKNHPKYGDKIYRKASWVGKREAIVNGTTYKVL